MDSPTESRLDRLHRQLNNAAGVGFSIGSALFFAGVPLQAVAPATIAAWTFFVGSIFFTLAGAAQLLDAMSPVKDLGQGVVWGHAARVAVLATAAQSCGTLEFNLNTWRGVLSAEGDHLMPTYVWRPDAIGSVLFLIASVLPLIPAVREHRHRHLQSRSWSIAWLNMIGSVLFAVSAVGAYTVTNNQALSTTWANIGTAGGALCFLAGAVLLIAPRPVLAAAKHPA